MPRWHSSLSKKKNDNAKHTLLKLNIILLKFTTFLEIIGNFIY